MASRPGFGGGAEAVTLSSLDRVRHDLIRSAFLLKVLNLDNAVEKESESGGGDVRRDKTDLLIAHVDIVDPFFRRFTTQDLDLYGRAFFGNLPRAVRFLVRHGKNLLEVPMRHGEGTSPNGEAGVMFWAGSGRYRKDPQNPHRIFYPHSFSPCPTICCLLVCE